MIFPEVHVEPKSEIQGTLLQRLAESGEPTRENLGVKRRVMGSLLEPKGIHHVRRELRPGSFLESPQVLDASKGQGLVDDRIPRGHVVVEAPVAVNKREWSVFLADRPFLDIRPERFRQCLSRFLETIDHGQGYEFGN